MLAGTFCSSKKLLRTQSSFDADRMQQTTAIRISLLAYLASITFSLLILPRIAGSQRINLDADRFGEVALNLAEGNGFVYEVDGAAVLERAPLYPILVAGVFTLVGGFSIVAVQVYQAILHAVTAFMVFLVGNMISTRRGALISQAVFAFHPIVIWYTGRLWVETTHVFLLVLVLMAFIRLLETPSAKRAALLGAIIGACCLLKPILLLFPLVVLVVMTWRYSVTGFRAGILVYLFMLVVIVPWTWRNYQFTNRVIPVNTSLGFNLIQGDVVGEEWLSGKEIMDTWDIAKARVDSLLTLSEVSWETAQGDSILVGLSVQRYFHQPNSYIRRSIANFSAFWYLSESQSKSMVVGGLQIFVLMLSLLSTYLMGSEKRRQYLPVFSMVLYYVLVNSAIVGWARYSMPMIPFLLLISSSLVDRIRLARKG